MISYNQHFADHDGNQLGDPEQTDVLYRAVDALGLDVENVTTAALIPTGLTDKRFGSTMRGAQC